MRTMGQRITAKREELNMKQKDLAIKVGITEASLSRYENDLRHPKAEILMKIASVLDLSPQFLITGNNDNQKTTMDDEYYDVIRIAKNKKISAQTIKMILDAISLEESQ